MDWFQSLILGILQGLTEFLPVSSSGHIELGKAILGANTEQGMMFTVVVHGATVLSTIVVFWKDILKLFGGLFKFKWNKETQYISLLVLSMIPTVIVGLLFEEQIEALFTGNLLFVGFMLLVTASLLAFTFYAKNTVNSVNASKSIVIGLAQAVAILPGISRSGSTIATGLLLGIDKEKITKFSFLMVILPIIGANIYSALKGDISMSNSVDILPLVIGFFASFISGLVACKLMIKIVKRGKLIYFAIYCSIVGVIAIIFGLL
ncbi:MAG: undecaprenyl-diphosphate phosphatase [Bacteroidota bacterium]|nr:undecaprenyl-diphosphate phosphatase [Bacteroidota bacterium]